jgi:hypothetical protein
MSHINLNILRDQAYKIACDPRKEVLTLNIKNHERNLAYNRQTQ